MRMRRTGFGHAAAARGLGQADRLPLDAVLADQRFILGDTVTGFEDELAAWLLDSGPAARKKSD